MTLLRWTGKFQSEAGINISKKLFNISHHFNILNHYFETVSYYFEKYSHSQLVLDEPLEDESDMLFVLLEGVGKKIKMSSR